MMNLYVGTYSKRGAEGIYALTLDPATGEIAVTGVLATLHSPSFLALHPAQPWLYAVCEEQAVGAVAALAVGAGRAEPLNWQSTLGKNPCHLQVDPAGEFVASANYSSGDVALHRIGADGRLEPASDFVHHEGSGPSPGRQEGPHAHSVNFDATGRFMVAADLGTDRLIVYELDRAQGKLRSHVPGGVVVQPGAGPRHFTFHPNQRWAYLINELDNTVVAYRWDVAEGMLTPLQALSTLPDGYDGESYCAEVVVHPSGRVLYGSNRGHDSLAIFRLDPESGLLEAAGHVFTEGEHPRSFAISPDGQWLLVANMYSDTIFAFRVGENGGLERVGGPVSLPSPSHLLFVLG